LWNSNVLGATNPVFLESTNNLIVKPNLAVATEGIVVSASRNFGEPFGVRHQYAGGSPLPHDSCDTRATFVESHNDLASEGIERKVDDLSQGRSRVLSVLVLKIDKDK
jgi:hypothetical protein